MKYVFIIVSCFLLFSCTKKNEDRSGLIKEELATKIETYKMKRFQACRNELLDEINMEVDSIMFYLVEKMQGTSDEMPARPARPGRLVDSIALEQKPQGKIEILE